MKNFFKVKTIDEILSLSNSFKKTEKELIDLERALYRILGENIYSDIDIPDFDRATMDGYAIKASSSFGSSESNPTYLNIKGKVEMGFFPDFSICDEEAAEISTGGALPIGTDSVIMIENTRKIDKSLIEIYKSLAPGNNVIRKSEDIKKNEISIPLGSKIRPQELGLIAASGRLKVKVFKKPIVALISTGNEIIPPNRKPMKGQIRDINTHTLSGQIKNAGGSPVFYGIIPDDFIIFKKIFTKALEKSDIVIVSGGSSLGSKDLTIDVIRKIKDTEILAHGIAISPGKPTILAKCGNKQIWGLPGHVASAMIVFKIIVQKFLKKSSGLIEKDQTSAIMSAILTRNVASSNGRVDYIRVKVQKQNNILFAEPIIGKSGLINTMIKANGLIKINMDQEGLYKDTKVSVIPL